MNHPLLLSEDDVYMTAPTNVKLICFRIFLPVILVFRVVVIGMAFLVVNAYSLVANWFTK